MRSIIKQFTQANAFYLFGRDIVHDLERMRKIILVTPSVHSLHSL